MRREEGRARERETNHAEAGVVKARQLHHVDEREDGLGEEVENTVCDDREARGKGYGQYWRRRKGRKEGWEARER